MRLLQLPDERKMPLVLRTFYKSFTVLSLFEVYQNKHYTKLRLIVDFIVGMTDSYAIDLYQELKGIKL